MIVGVLLAAGSSSRMGRMKALIRRGTGTFATHTIRTLWRVCDCVIVVLGSNARVLQSAIEEEFAQLVEKGQLQLDMARAKVHRKSDLEVRFVTNPRWKRGMLGSVQTGLGEALMLKPEAVMVHPVDHPEVAPETVSSLAEVMRGALAAAKPKERKIFSYGLIPRHRGRRGHPVVLSPALAAAVRRDTEALDLSDAVRRSCRLLGYLDVADSGIAMNINRPADRRVRRKAG